MKKLLKIYTDARPMLVFTHSILFVLLVALGITIFTLPRSVEDLLAVSDSWDIFYKFIYQFLVEFAEERYVRIGTFVTVLGFGQLISAIIIHGRYRKFLFFNVVIAIPLFLLFPVGAFFAVWLIVLTYMYFDQSRVS